MTTPGLCRTGDSFAGTCNNHTHPQAFTGVWGAGASILTADGLTVIRVGDTAPASCGHTAKAIAGSVEALGGGLALHRQGDAITIVEGSHGTGTSTSGSSIVTAV